MKRTLIIAIITGLVLAGTPVLAQDKPDLEKLQLKVRALNAEAEVFRLRFTVTRQELIQAQKALQEAQKAAQKAQKKNPTPTPRPEE